MGSFEIVHDVGEAIVTLLQARLNSDVIKHKDEIALCNIEDREKFKIAVSLYDVQECREMNQRSMLNKGVSMQVKPPLFLDLHYVISVNSDADIKYRAMQEQVILGRILQIMYDEGTNIQQYVKRKNISSVRMNLELEYISLEEKLRVFNVSGKSYKPSLYYKVCPVELISQQGKEIPRIRSLDQSVDKSEDKSKE